MKMRLFLRILLSAIVLSAGIFLFIHFGYAEQFFAVDHILGALPIVFLVLAEGAALALIWMRHTKKRGVLSLSVAALFLLSAALFPNALYENWWIQSGFTEEVGGDPPLDDYAPWTGSKTAALDGEAALQLSADLPVLDGALALYPLYSAAAQAVYDRAACEAKNSVCFTDTVQAVRELISGDRDVVFTAAPSAAQREEAKKRGAELYTTPIGREAFVFLAGKDNPVDSLTVRQIRNIYSGKTARWATLGWKEGGTIFAPQRPEGSGSQTGLQAIMKGSLIVPQPLPKEVTASNSMMEAVSARINGVQSVLGYSYRFFATVMRPNADAKLLSIENIPPQKEEIASGKYPFTVNFYAVTLGEPKGNTKLLIDWLLSSEGQELIERVGYVPL